MIIEIKNLKKSFKENIVFDNVNVSFETGKIYGIVGKNGSGKSVFLKLLCGFYYPTSGTILFDKTNYINEKSFPKELLALIEKPSFFPDLTAFENLKVLANIQNNIDDEQIREMLELVNLENNKKKFYQFSAGMKQKLGIASVLMENPKIIILDEPFNAIEEETVNKIKEYLKSIKKDKIIIVSSHHKDDLEDLKAEIIYKFNEGKVEKVNEI